MNSSFRGLVASTLLVVACSSDLSDDGPPSEGNSPAATPSAGNPAPDAGANGGIGGASASPTSTASNAAAQGGSAAAVTGDEDEPGGGFGGAPSESDDGGPGADDPASGNDRTKTGDGGASGKASDEVEPEVLALEDCNLAAPFDPPVPAFTGTTIAEGITFSQDGLTAYVSSKFASSTYDIYVATRTLTSDPFGALTQLSTTTFNRPWDERSPSLSADGLRLYLTAGNEVMVSTRTLLTQAFPAYASVGAPVSGPHPDSDPFLRAGTNELYFVSEADHDTPNPLRRRNLFVSTLQANGFTAPAGLSVNLANEEDDRPIVSPDGLTLYFASMRPGIGGDTGGDIWIAKRNNLAEDFGPPTNLYALNTSTTDLPVAISSNGCTLYFASTRDTGNFNRRLYQATRGSSIPSTVTTTLKIFGTGSITTPGYQCSSTCNFQGAPDTTVLLQANGGALWTGSCTGNNGSGSDGVFVFTPGGTCTVTFSTGPGGSGSGCDQPSDCQSGLECTLGTCRCPSGSGCSALCPCGPGGPCTAQNQCQSGLACTNGTCSCPAGGPCSAQCPCPPGGSCTATNQCQSGLECANGTCACSCTGKPCGASDGCGGTCTCGPGEEGCSTDADCDAGLLCIDEICKPLGCLENPVLAGCGFPGAPCGPCTKNPQCETNADCPPGLVCRDGNGWRYGVPGTSVCEEEDCPGLDCGQITSTCGLCECTANCSGKECGDVDLSDGCYGRCTGVCDDGELGCVFDADCQPGSVCLDGICRPSDPCLKPNLAPPDCGSGSECGPCPESPTPECADRVCGPDPVTGASCGPICGAGSFCTAAGQCAPSGGVLDPIRVPTGDGSDRPVVAPPAPPAPSDVESIPGTFVVSDAGMTTYSIPIEVPPGRVVQPELALSYVSGAPNGALGVGWSVSGLSSISRCARSFAQDGRVAPVKGTNEDALCLDGKRLVPVPGTTEWLPGAEYRTEVDTFARVRLESGPRGLFFRVHMKDGRIFLYGQDAQSRTDFQDGITDTWALDRVMDRSGNFMTIAYRMPAFYSKSGVGTSELLPHSIHYTGHGSVQGDREIIFGYKERADVLNAFRPGGGLLTRSLLLETIDVRAQNQNVRRYTLDYEYKHRVNRLTNVKRCDGATFASCKLETELAYFDDHAFGETKAGAWPSPETTTQPSFLPTGMVHRSGNTNPSDMFTSVSVSSYGWVFQPIPSIVIEGLSFAPPNGPHAAAVLALANALLSDSDTDYLYFTQTAQFGTAPGPIVPGSLIEFRQVCGGNAPPRRQTYSPVVAREGQSIYDTCPLGVGGTSVLVQPVWLTDLDGDGVQDKLWCPSPFAHTLDVKFAGAAASTSAGVPTEATSAQRDLEIPAWGDMCPAPGFSSTFDVDGDGLSNLVVFDRDLGWAALVYDGTNFSWNTQWFEGISVEPNDFHWVTPIDANGDGLKDLLALPNSARIAWNTHTVMNARLAVNSGNGFYYGALKASEEDMFSPKYPGQVLDLDGDGIEELVDAVRVNLGGFEHTYRWRSRRIENGRIVTTPLPTLDDVPPGVFGDFDGDGDADVLSGQGHSVRLTYGDAVARNSLRTVIDGLGHRIDATYFHPNTVEEDCGSWPQRCYMKAPHPVVRTHTESHYEDRVRTAASVLKTDRVSTYTYGQPRTDLAGHGWLGFNDRKVETRDGAGAFLSKTEFTYKAPPTWDPATSSVPYVYATAGLVENITVTSLHPSSSLTDDPSESYKLQVHTHFDWEEQRSSADIPFPVLTTKTTRTSADSGGALHETIESFLVDEFGNVYSEERRSHDLEDPAIGPNVPVPNSQSVLKINRSFSPTTAQQEAWLISLPSSINVNSTPRCDMAPCLEPARQHVSFDYYPDTDLLHFERREMGNADLQREREFFRDDFGNVRGVTTTDARGNVRHSETTFDGRGMFPMTTSVFGEGIVLTTQVRYDDRFGRLSVRADPNGIDETYSYDEFGVMRHYRGPSGVTDINYEPADPYVTPEGVAIPAVRRTITTQLEGKVTIEETNSFGQPVRSQVSGFDDEWVFEEFVYDARQRLQFQSRPHTPYLLPTDLNQGTVEFVYDGLDRVKLERHADGGETSHSWVIDRRTDHGAPARATILTEEVTDPRDNVTRRSTDRNGQVVLAEDAFGVVTRYSYGAFNKLVEIELPSEGTITFEYDGWGRLLSTDDAARGGPETAQYDGLDQIILTGDEAGRTRNLFYDDFGRTERIEDPDGVTQFFYDGAGPNQLGRLVETVSPTGQRVSYEFEAPQSDRNRGLMNRVTRRLIPAPGGTEVTLVTGYHFDEFSRLDQLDYPGAAGSSLSLSYDFDDVGNVIRVDDTNDQTQTYWRFGNDDQGYRVGVERVGTVECVGAGTSGPGMRTQRDYFPLTGKLKSTKTRCGDAIIQDLSYQYDLAGNMTRRENAVGTTPPEVFGYDALNRPGTMNGDDIHYFNNDFGSLHSTAALGLYEYQGGGGDWIASAGDNSFDQDAVGNVIQRQGPDIPGQIQTIDYTSFDLPSSITGGPAGATFTVDFSYDADKKRVVKRKQSAQTPTTTTFYADSLYQRVETEGAPTRHRSMIYANGRAVAEYFVDEGISGPPRIRYLYHDALGSIKTITDSNGTNPITREYAPFGLRTSSTSSDDLPYGFTGHEEDMELGLVNMKGRMYDPVIGQFLTADPVRANIFSVQGLNRFAYVENSPLNFIDPSGFILEDVLDVGGRVVEAAVLSYAGGSLAGQYGGQSAYMSKDYMKFHGSLNGALSGARQIYSLDGEGFRSFYLDSTNGIHGTALGNYVNVFNTSLEASGVRGTDNNWTTRFSPGLSERENRHVFFGGFRLAPGYAHTQGNVVSNFRGSDDLMSHEQEHVMTSRVFGLSYQATYYSWFIGGAAIGLGQSIYETLDIAATEGRLEFDWKKAESNIRSKGYRSNPWEMHAYCAHNRSDWDRENNPFCQ